MNYQDYQNQFCDLQKGDTVKVIRIPKPYEMGWGDGLFPLHFKVGDSAEVLKVSRHDNSGISVRGIDRNVDAFPYFCLELVKRKNPSVEEGQVWVSERGTLYVVALTGFNERKFYSLIALRSQNRFKDDAVNITIDVLEEVLSDFSYKGKIEDFLR